MDIYAVNNKNMNALLSKLKEDLAAFPDGMNSLDAKLEATSKHLPAYLKIVKAHIDQLAKILHTENHYNRTIDAISLAEPVKQLITLFRVLEEQDLQNLEDLAKAAKNWQLETNRALEDDLIQKNATMAS